MAIRINADGCIVYDDEPISESGQTQSHFNEETVVSGDAIVQKRKTIAESLVDDGVVIETIETTDSLNDALSARRMVIAQNTRLITDDRTVIKRKEIADRLRNSGAVETDSGNGEIKSFDDAPNSTVHKLKVDKVKLDS